MVVGLAMGRLLRRARVRPVKSREARLLTITGRESTALRGFRIASDGFVAGGEFAGK